MDTTGQRLIWARTRAGFKSARQAALDNEWPESTYRAQEGDRRSVLEHDAKKYARRFGVSWKWLLRNEGEPTTAPTPLPKEIEIDREAPEDQVTLIVRQTRGVRYFTRGHMYYTDGRKPPSELLGEECVVRLPDGRTLIRTLRQGAKPNTYNLEGPRGQVIENQRIEWAEPLRLRG